MNEQTTMTQHMGHICMPTGQTINEIYMSHYI